MRRFVIRAIGLTMPLLTAACSISWQEADGSRRILGLVSLRLTETADHPTFAGNAVNITTIGLGVAATGTDTIVNFGYLNSATANLRDNALVLGNPLILPGTTVLAATP